MIWILYIFLAYLLWKCIELLLRYPWIMKLTNRHVVVTGCDTGFGHEIAKELDRYEITVYAGCYTELGQKILKESCSFRMKPFHLDVSSRKSIQKAFDFVSSDLPEGKGLWGIINNAGVGGSHRGPIDWLNSDDHKEVFDVNYFGMVMMTNTFLPLLKKEKGSRIVNTASVLGRLTLSFTGPYTASKHAVEGFSSVLRTEIKPFDISVHIVEPTIIHTGIVAQKEMEKGLEKTWNRLTQSSRDEYGEQYIRNLRTIGIDSFLKMGSSDTSPVIDAYKHAILGMFPKKRYVVGRLVHFFWLMMVLPDWILDLVADLDKINTPAASLKKN